jgi:multidrug efflux pump subunit AcrB
VLKTDERVVKQVENLRRTWNSQGIHLVTLYDAPEGIRAQIQEIRDGAFGGKIGEGPLANAGYLLGGIWLIVLAMLFFVSWRAALISAAAIPLSLLFTLLSLKLMGISLNTLTLFSMILVLGLVVDPAIVVLEAIQREIDLGKRGITAVRDAIRLIGGGLFMAVLTSVIAFIPFGIVSGVFGEIIRYIPLTVIPALVASYFIPLLFLTYLAQRFLHPDNRSVNPDEEASLWRSSRWIIRANRAILNRKWLQIAIVLLATVVPFGVTGFLFATQRITPVQFSATDDSDWLIFTAQFPANLSSAQKHAFLNRLEPIIQSVPAIESYFPMDQQNGGATFMVRLLPRRLRDQNAADIAADIQKQFDLAQDPAQRVFFTAKVSGVGVPENDYPVSVNIYGDDLDTLKKAAIRTGDVLREERFRETVTRVEDGYTGVTSPQVLITVKRDQAQQYGLSAIQIAQTLSAIVGQTAVTKFEQEIDGAIRQTEVFLLNASQPANLNDLTNLIFASTPTGQPIRLQDIATIEQRDGVPSIQRLNGSRYVTVQAKVADPLKDAAAPQKAVKDFWTADNLKAYGLQADALEDRGAGDEFLKSFRELFIALAVAILLTYIAMVYFFRSFFQPFIILFAVPLSFLGVFPALSLIGGQFGFLEILGIITLVGIVENVGIFLIDLANRRQRDGEDYRDAIAVASGIRFRAIFLTKITALGGLIPLIIVSPFWRSLALVTVAGILVSGILSLFTTPSLYAWHYEFKGWLRRLPQRIAARRQKAIVAEEVVPA